MADQVKESRDTKAAKEDAGVAQVADNERLKHTVELEGDEGQAVTTRDDLLDLGVPMVQGAPSEPQGPEDAFGEGPKRGDYSDRTGGVRSFESVPVDTGRDPYVRDGDGNIVDNKPHTQVVAQVPRASDQGEVEGLKGGVDTDPRVTDGGTRVR